MFKDVLRIIMIIVGFFGAIGGVISMRLAPIFFVVLFILKIVNVINIDWFGYPNELSAIGTPFWLAFLGLLFYILNAVLVAVGVDDKIWQGRRKIKW